MEVILRLALECDS